MGNLRLFLIAALVLGLVGVGYSQGKKKETLAPKEGPSGSMTPLGKNAQGFEEYRNEKDGSTMILIPAGEFTMGSNGFGPIHTVYLDAYYIGKYEVTVGQFREFCSKNARRIPDQLQGKLVIGVVPKIPSRGKEVNNPVVNVTWEDASAYASWAGLRLLTEAEWEKAARGTDARVYPWGDDWGEAKCNSLESGNFGISLVGSFPQGGSPCGALDLAGNVAEWCADWYDINYYQFSPKNNPKGQSSGSARAVRGGSWNDIKFGCWSASRFGVDPQARNVTLGFRVCR